MLLKSILVFSCVPKNVPEKIRITPKIKKKITHQKQIWKSHPKEIWKISSVNLKDPKNEIPKTTTTVRSSCEKAKYPHCWCWRISNESHHPSPTNSIIMKGLGQSRINPSAMKFLQFSAQDRRQRLSTATINVNVSTREKGRGDGDLCKREEEWGEFVGEWILENVLLKILA